MNDTKVLVGTWLSGAKVGMLGTWVGAATSQDCCLLLAGCRVRVKWERKHPRSKTPQKIRAYCGHVVLPTNLWGIAGDKKGHLGSSHPPGSEEDALRSKEMMMKMMTIADCVDSIFSVPATVLRALRISPHFTSTSLMR